MSELPSTPKPESKPHLELIKGEKPEFKPPLELDVDSQSDEDLMDLAKRLAAEHLDSNFFKSKAPDKQPGGILHHALVALGITKDFEDRLLVSEEERPYLDHYVEIRKLETNADMFWRKQEGEKEVPANPYDKAYEAEQEAIALTMDGIMEEFVTSENTDLARFFDALLGPLSAHKTQVILARRRAFMMLYQHRLEQS